MPEGKNKKLNGLMKDESCGEILKNFVGLRAKYYSYLIDDGSEYKKQISKKVCHRKT